MYNCLQSNNVFVLQDVKVVLKKHVNPMRFNRQNVKYGNSVRERVIYKGKRFG
jgi:hypothetical protein